MYGVAYRNATFRFPSFNVSHEIPYRMASYQSEMK